MNKAKLILDITSLAVACSGGIMAVANQVTAIPGLPGWFVNAWPAVMAGALVIDRVGSIIINFLKSQQTPGDGK